MLKDLAILCCYAFALNAILKGHGTDQFMPGAQWVVYWVSYIPLGAIAFSVLHANPRGKSIAWSCLAVFFLPIVMTLGVSKASFESIGVESASGYAWLVYAYWACALTPLAAAVFRVYSYYRAVRAVKRD